MAIINVDRVMILIHDVIFLPVTNGLCDASHDGTFAQEILVSNPRETSRRGRVPEMGLARRLR